MTLGGLWQRATRSLQTATSRGSFAQSVGLLLGGTVVGRAIPILSLPLLTRLYDPADFGLLAVYTGALAILSVAACLRFEIAIPLPDDETTAANLLALAVASTAVISLLCLGVIASFPDAIVSTLGAPGLRPFLWLLPVGVFAAGAYSATQYWATRHSRFRAVAVTRVAQSAVGSFVSLGMGAAGVSPLGLLLGNMMSTSLGFVGLGREAFRREFTTLKKVRLSGMAEALRAYRRFPTYSTFDALANAAGMQVPVILIATLASGPEAGFLLLAMQVMRLPIALLGSAIAQVYLSRAAQEDREGNLPAFTTKVVRNLVRLGVGPLLFIGLASPAAFSLAFGDQWSRAGELVVWMTPWFILQFISSPISMVMHIRGRQGLLLAVTLLGGIVRVAAVLLADRVFGTGVAESYAIASTIFYVAVCAVCFHVARVKFADAIFGRLEMLSIGAGLALGACVVLLAQSL